MVVAVVVVVVIVVVVLVEVEQVEQVADRRHKARFHDSAMTLSTVAPLGRPFCDISHKGDLRGEIYFETA
jgi:hypothetical protein